MSNEAMEYAKALAAELDHLEGRWDAVNKMVGTLDREITAARENLLEVVKGLGGTVVIGNKVYTLDGARLVTLEAAVAGQPQGQGHYDPATQSVVRWKRLGDLLPPEDTAVLAIPKGRAEPAPVLYHPAEQQWENRHGGRRPTASGDLWAELPQPPRGESDARLHHRGR